VGRAVYRLFDERKHYSWYGDSIQDMVGFFEKLGYSYIMYKILTDNIEVLCIQEEQVPHGLQHTLL
jgi:hypothetical protein